MLICPSWNFSYYKLEKVLAEELWWVEEGGQASDRCDGLNTCNIGTSFIHFSCETTCSPSFSGGGVNKLEKLSVERLFDTFLPFCRVNTCVQVTYRGNMFPKRQAGRGAAFKIRQSLGTL